jgi:hypothetical protein
MFSLIQNFNHSNSESAIAENVVLGDCSDITKFLGQTEVGLEERVKSHKEFYLKYNSFKEENCNKTPSLQDEDFSDFITESVCNKYASSYSLDKFSNGAIPKNVMMELIKCAKDVIVCLAYKHMRLLFGLGAKSPEMLIENWRTTLRNTLTHSSDVIVRKLDQYGVLVNTFGFLIQAISKGHIIKSISLEMLPTLEINSSPAIAKLYFGYIRQFYADGVFRQYHTSWERIVPVLHRDMMVSHLFKFFYMSFVAML